MRCELFMIGLGNAGQRPRKRLLGPPANDPTRQAKV
jgi:hypothetical protein